MTRKYRPSNGSEGDRFTEKYCETCTKDADLSCEILARTMCHDAEDDGYPKEWTYDAKDSPICTAYIKAL